MTTKGKLSTAALQFQSKPLEDVPFEQVAKGIAPFPLSTFENFLRVERAEENLDFYREVLDFKESFDSDKVNGSVETKYIYIVQKYIEPGSDFEVNIPGDMKDHIIGAQKEKRISGDVFDDAQREILGVMHTDKYPRFLKLLKSTNLNDDLASQAVRLGVSLFMIGVIICLVFIGVQIYATNELESRSSTTLQTLSEPYFRFLAMPFFFQGMGFIVSGKYRLCGICAAAGNNYNLQDSKSLPPYVKVIYREILVNLGIKSPPKQNDTADTCQICVFDIANANRRKSTRYGRYVFAFTVLFMVGVLAIPPNDLFYN